MVPPQYSTTYAHTAGSDTLSGLLLMFANFQKEFNCVIANIFDEPLHLRPTLQVDVGPRSASPHFCIIYAPSVVQGRGIPAISANSLAKRHFANEFQVAAAGTAGQFFGSNATYRILGYIPAVTHSARFRLRKPTKLRTERKYI